MFFEGILILVSCHHFKSDGVFPYCQSLEKTVSLCLESKLARS
jgi:hypothetical protein